ncbi:hypothetical protein E4H12_16015 [Candidatus Thorarchaeota archaeon]|nr:MAG: hypothetical protein E4H12_16015 [Candidatus Thorarchaeota archaeon]
MSSRNRRSRSDTSTPFIDVKFILLMGIAFMFIIAFMLINPPQAKKIDPKAEAMILLTWPDGNYDDVDMWLKLPSGKAVGYRSKDMEYVHLERDDLGITNDIVYSNDVALVNRTNREVIMFRQMVDGHYILNLYFFKDKDASDNDVKRAGLELEPAPIRCKVIIIQLNPKYVELATFLVTLNKEDDEKTVVQFDITNGHIGNFIRDEVLFVGASDGSVGAMADPGSGGPM